MNRQYSFSLDDSTQLQAERQFQKPANRVSNAVKERLTEIILPNLPTATDDLLMPIIAKLSQPGERWLTWVTSEKLIKQRLLANGINLEHLRIVVINADTDYSVIDALLELGNSHTVIAEIGQIDDMQRFDMEQSAAMGDTNAILVTQKTFFQGTAKYESYS